MAPDGRITRVNQTLCAWTGYACDDFAGKRVHQFLNMAGRIYFETHIAPLLRMQGFFNEFALDFLTAGGDRMPVIANAVEQRSDDGSLLSTRLVVIKAVDRRRYERELVEARALANETLKSERETADLREQFIAVLGHDLRTPSPGPLIKKICEFTEPILCDGKRIGQLVSNLVGNALTHGSHDQPVRVGARTGNGILELWVANAGNPIREAARKRLFEPFFRGDVRDSRQGLGLGL